jgi:hypothetical protein
VIALGDEIKVGIGHGETVKAFTYQAIRTSRAAEPVAQAAEAMRHDPVLDIAGHHAIPTAFIEQEQK